MKLAVVAFPHLENTDRQWIESFRAKHDPQAARITVHFTLVFPIDATADEVDREIVRVSTKSTPFNFVIQRAEAVADHFGHGFHVFLVPDEGTTRITALHGELHAGTLRSHLRSDIPFVRNRSTNTV